MTGVASLFGEVFGGGAVVRALRVLPLVSVALLPACSLFDDSDPREGAEGLSECVNRVTKLTRGDFNDVGPADGTFVPTYTYDITKLDLDTIQKLSVAGSDETAGRRLDVATNERSTAIARFKELPVDEAGAFFMASDPSLYRVRGKAGPLDKLIAMGCDRQQANMRLIEVDLGKPAPVQPADTDSSTEAGDTE